MTTTEFYDLLRQSFPFVPTEKQRLLLHQLATFVLSKDPQSLYLLKGYAGTGKTTLVGALVSNLLRVDKRAVLLAPTGRAAKVISNYSKKEAFTIHKKIYTPRRGQNGTVRFVLQTNKHRNTIFIVDEASMISDTVSDFKGRDQNALLDDLMQYVYAGHQCKLLIIGDTAQLPPVSLALSPALNHDTLALNYDKNIAKIELDEVVRQDQDSGILANATRLRNTLKHGVFESFKFQLTHYTDIIRLRDGYEIMDAISDAYHNRDNEDTTIIVRSNKRANLYNQQIRSRILFNDDQLSAGDHLMVVKNNYFWVKPNSEAGFIANGDIIEVLEIFKIEALYGFSFAEVKVQMIDYPKMPPFETVLLLDTITTETASLSYDDSNKLYQEVLKDYEDEPTKYKKFLKVKNNKYFNALQVKFSYAITCHKSQGGQWHTVFVEHPYLPDGMDAEYLRWLYTALTRAQKKAYLIGFPEVFFDV